MLASGRPDMALPMFLAIAQSDTASEVSLSRASLGAGMCHWQMGDDLSANKFWSRASNHAKAAGEAAKTYLAQAYSLRGSLYESWDELETALAFSRSSLEINKTLPDPPPGELAYGYNNIGAIYFGKCDWDKAIEYYTQSHRAYISDSLEVEAALPLTNLGLAWLRKEEFANAIECFRKAQAGVLEEGDPNLVGSLYNNWGLACVQTGKTDTAIALLQRVLQLEDAPMHQIASAQANLGFAYLRAQSPAEALPWLQKALGQSEGGLKAAKRAKVLLHLGETQLALGQAPAALQSTDEGIGLLLGLPMDTIWTPGILLGPNRDARTLFQLLAARAATLSTMGKLPQASETYQWALQISDQMRQDLLARGSKLFLSSYVLPVLEAALENEWQLQATTFKQRPADFQQRMNLILSLFERNKALMLQEERQAAEAMRTAGIPAPVLERERSLQSDIDFYAQKAFEARQAGNKVDLEKIERQIFEKNSALDKIRQTLDAQFPAIRQQKAQVFKADLAALQAYARSENILIVEYFWGQSAVYAFTMAPEGPRFLRLCGNIAAISQAARDLAASLANWSAILSDPAAAESVFQRSSKLLSDSLLAPVFGGRKPAELLCIPDGPLARIPLEALPMPGSPLSGGWVGFPYLIRQVEVRYAWSAALLLGPKPHLPSPKNKAVLA
ncbi:MAG TPA: tetratricopeptide repeat protein, partial [Bacteroidia bacterium]|nr:tetratricopeptide repeat protein [Bacteroidia bacterium]